MEKILYNRNGDAVAYLSSDHHATIYLWDGLPAAYLYEEQHVYGYNGRHLGWFRDEVLYDHGGKRIGFTYTTCPVSIAKPPAKGKRIALDEMKSRWTAPSSPKFGHELAGEDLADFLRQGAAARYTKKPSPENSSSSPPSPQS